MKKLALISLFIINVALGQEFQEVRVCFNAGDEERLSQCGIDFSHADLKDNCVTSVVSIQEVQILQQEFEVEVLDLNPSNTLEQRLQENIQYRVDCVQSYDLPEHYAYGSMGGYFTYSEILHQLDSMKLAYPDLISSRQSIGSFTTAEGRSIEYVTITNQEEIGTKSNVLYTALHHAREPATVMEIITYMWYLLENAGENAEVDFILANTNLYFVPCVNPDGYVYNESTHPNGGGLWRKNRRPNGGNEFGVDLNRNYGYQWGVSGASSSPSSSTYMGLQAFSEPETQAIKHLTEQVTFSVALNAHTHGNKLLYPFGYSAQQVAIDDAWFHEAGEYLCSQNDFEVMQSSFLYPASGDSDDWMYADESTKPKIFAFTPEIGGSIASFWPSLDQLDELCAEMIRANLNAALIARPHLKVETDLPSAMMSTESTVRVYYQSIGLNHLPNAEINFYPVEGVENSSFTTALTGLDYLGRDYFDVELELSPGLRHGDRISFVLEQNYGGYILTDTLETFFSEKRVSFEDDFEDLNTWIGNWVLTDRDSLNGQFSLTNVLSGNYPNNTSRIIEMDSLVDLSQAVSATLSFWAKWEIEFEYDYFLIEIQQENGTWEELCTPYAHAGTQYQDNASHDGFKTHWVNLEVDLVEYLQERVKLRFVFSADAGVNAKGVLIDNLSIQALIDPTLGVENDVISEQIVFPNPAKSSIIIRGLSDVVNVHIINMQGQKESIERWGSFIDLSKLSSGSYLVIIETKETVVRQKIVIE